MNTVVPYRDCIANAKSCLLRPTNISLGIAVIVLSSILFAPTSQTATKFLAGTFPLWQILFFRSLGQTAWMLVFFWPTERGNLFRTRHLGTHLARSTLLFASTICWTSAIAHVPLTTASSISSTASASSRRSGSLRATRSPRRHYAGDGCRWCSCGSSSPRR